MRAVFATVVLASLVTLTFGSASAQVQGAAEIGFDFGLNYSITDSKDTPLGTIDVSNITALGAPASDFGQLLQNFRVGWCVTRTSELETAFGFSYVSGAGVTIWQSGVGVDYMHNFSSGQARPFVRVGPTLTLLHSNRETHSQVGVGAGGGVRTALSDRLALRFEAGANRLFETNEQIGRWDILASVGLSFFTK